MLATFSIKELAGRRVEQHEIGVGAAHIDAKAIAGSTHGGRLRAPSAYSSRLSIMDRSETASTLILQRFPTRPLTNAG